MEFREEEEMNRVSEAEPNSTSIASSSDNSTFLLEKARKLLRGKKRKSSPCPSCSINSPLCESYKMKRMLIIDFEEVMKLPDDAEKIEQNRTDLSSSSESETDALQLEMTLGGNKELWEMHWLGLEEKTMKKFDNDKTGDNSTLLSPAPSCSVICPFPVESNDRNEGLDTEALEFLSACRRLAKPIELLEAQRLSDLRIKKQNELKKLKVLEVQRLFDLRIKKQKQLEKLNKNQHK